MAKEKIPAELTSLADKIEGMPVNRALMAILQIHGEETFGYRYLDFRRGDQYRMPTASNEKILSMYEDRLYKMQLTYEGSYVKKATIEQLHKLENVEYRTAFVGDPKRTLAEKNHTHISIW